MAYSGGSAWEVGEHVLLPPFYQVPPMCLRGQLHLAWHVMVSSGAPTLDNKERYLCVWFILFILGWGWIASRGCLLPHWGTGLKQLA